MEVSHLSSHPAYMPRYPTPTARPAGISFAAKALLFALTCASLVGRVSAQQQVSNKDPLTFAIQLVGGFVIIAFVITKGFPCCPPAEDYDL